MKIIKKFLITAVAAMPVFLCSCPGGSYTNNEPEDPHGYIVKMGKDYSENVMAYMCATQNDTVYSINEYISKIKHTNKLNNDYYQITGVAYNQIAYTSILLSDWDDSTIYTYEPIDNYIIDANPFEEIYAYYRNYTVSDLLEIIKKGDFSTFEKIK